MRRFGALFYPLDGHPWLFHGSSEVQESSLLSGGKTMRVCLVGPEIEENLGLRYLHSSLRKTGHHPRIVPFEATRMIPLVTDQVLGLAPDVVGLSMVFTGRAREFVSLAESLRRASYRGHITAGGHFATFHAGSLLRDFPAIDSIVHGEGEETLVDLVENLPDLESVRGISFRPRTGSVMTTVPRPNPDDLDSRPWPTRPDRFADYLGLPIANMLSSRGCHANCHFCSINAWYRQNPGRRFRRRGVEAVADEMAWLYHQRGVRIFNFHDDNFFLPGEADNLRRIRALRACLAERDVRKIGIQVKARPDAITEPVVAALKAIGLFRVFLGVETNAVAGLRTLGRGIRREQNHEALRILRCHDIHTTFNLLMFDPESTMDDLADNIAFIRRYATFPLNFGRTEVYSGTALEKRLRAEGRLLGDYFGHHYRIADARAQRVFELYRRVFLHRCFGEGSMNNEAMRLDYYAHILRHFYPERYDPQLGREAAQLIAQLNRNSAEILQACRDFVSESGSNDTTAMETFAARLAKARADCERTLRGPFEGLIQQVQKCAGGTPRRMARVPLSQAASAAAIALAIGVAGCKSEQPAKQPQPPVSTTPTTPSATPVAETTRGPVDATPEQFRAIKGHIMTEYGRRLAELAEKHNANLPNATFRLVIDERGRIQSWTLQAPGADEDALRSVRADLTREVKSWRFPMIEEETACTVEVPIRPPFRTHMTEMMMAPMGDN
jgi:radical SAM superfamily enzyme YgiQ (UPF0313 family)